MHRDADGARLIGDGAGDGLADPPRRIGGELVALAVIEFFDRLDEPEVPLLDQVEKEHAASHVALGDGDDQAQVRLGELALGLRVALGHAAGDLDLLAGGEQRDLADLLEVHAHRVVDVHALHGGERVLDLGDLLVDVLGDLHVLDHVDIHFLEVLIDLFDLLLVQIQLLERIHDLLIGQDAF